jgi:sulfite exporter TauE/SafE
MLPLAFGLMGWLPTIRWVENNPLSRKTTGIVAKLLASPTTSASLVLGLANGFLPCGPVYTAGLTAASTGNPWQGFLAMLFYGMGTVPVMVGFGFGGARLLQSRNRPLLQKFAALLVLIIGVQLVMRGFAAFDLVPHLKFGELVFW